VTAVAARPPTRIGVPRARGAGQQLATVALAVVVVGGWELACRTALADSYVLAAPSAIVGQVADEWSLYRRNLAVTLEAAAWGFLWGNLAGIALAVVATTLRPLRPVVHRVALTVTCLPLIALAPILRVVSGPGETPQVALAALAVFFTTLVAAELGLGSADPAAVDVVRALGGGRVEVLARVRLRAAVPAVVAGAQVAAPAAFLGALVGEFTGAERGFGILMIQALRTLETDRVWAVAAVSTAVAVVAYLGVGWVGRRLAPWSPPVVMTPPSTGRPPDRHRWLRAAAELVASTLAVLGLWLGFLRWFDLDPFFAKGPSDVWAHLVSEPGAGAQRGELLSALGETAQVTALGFVAGLLAATLAAIAFVVCPPIERALLPIAVALRSVPILATTPVLILVFGRGTLGTTVLVAVMSFFPTLVNVVFGLRSTSPQLLDVLAVGHASVLQTTWWARLPSALPALFASARIAVPASFLGATVAEWLATGKGIGNVMVVASGTARYDVLWSAVVLVTLAAVAAHALVVLAERVVLARVAPEHLTR
jgi:sulfonate transport system permease protein